MNQKSRKRYTSGFKTQAEGGGRCGLGQWRGRVHPGGRQTGRSRRADGNPQPGGPAH